MTVRDFTSKFSVPSRCSNRIRREASSTAESRSVRGGARRGELSLPSLAGPTQASASQVVCRCQAAAPRSRHRFTTGHPALAWIRPANDGPGRAPTYLNPARSLDALPGPPAAATKAPRCRFVCSPPLPLRASAVKKPGIAFSATVGTAVAVTLPHRPRLVDFRFDSRKCQTL